MEREVLLVSMLLMVGSRAAEFEPCGGKPADVFFVLDSSGSISRDDFRKELQFTEDVASMLDTRSKQVRVGIISFSMTVNPEFGLGEYADSSDMMRKISDVKYEGLGTNTAEALTYLYTKGLSKDKVRPGIPHIAIVLTDGMSQNMADTITEAEQTHKAGITVFAIGIGSQVDKTELTAMGSKPTGRYVFTIDNFDALNKIKEMLVIKACEVEPITPSPDIQNEAAIEDELTSHGRCTPQQPLDLVFAVDTAAIGASNTHFALQLIAEFSSRINMETSDTSITIIGNGCSNWQFHDEPAMNPQSVKALVTHAQSDTPQFNQIIRNLRLKAAEGRRGSSHIGMVILTDRLSPAEFKKSRLEVQRARYRGISIYVIGVGDRLDDSQANGLIVNDGEYIHVDSFDNLREVGRPLLISLCMLGTEQK